MLFSIPMAGAVFFDHLVHRAFAVLPFGARSQPETGDIAPGPIQARLSRRGLPARSYGQL
jgi:predicted secreted protein